MPEDFFSALQARLSQPGMPHQFLLTPNPPNEDHWLSRTFPTDNSRLHLGYRYIRTTVYDNRVALGEDYIEDLEAAYPAGTVLRRRFIEGLRGLSVVGDPVYGGYFQRALHVEPQLAHNREAPLLEGWDFGHGHPCVVWAQFVPTGRSARPGRFHGGLNVHRKLLPGGAPISRPLVPWRPGGPLHR